MHLTDICRLCLIKSSKTCDELFFPIDDAFERKFNEITNLILHKYPETTTYPSTVCISCVTELESHYNYRCGLIAKQKRLNVLLGIKADYEETNKIKSDESEVESQVYKEESHEEANASSSEGDLVEDSDMLEQEDPDMEFVCDEEEMINYNYEQVFTESTGEEYEADQEYIEDNESDEKYYIVKDDVENDENFIIIEDPQTETPIDVKQKRKYIKQSKDAVKPFKCFIEDCTSLFSFRATMRKHLLTIHNVLCDKCTCLICGKRFEEYSQFLAHVKIHTRKSECDICKLRFVNDEKMLAHRARVHANDFEERCYPCGVDLINI